MGEYRGSMSPTLLLEDGSLVPGGENQPVGMQTLAFRLWPSLESVNCYGDEKEGLKRATPAGTDPRAPSPSHPLSK